jgi:hypothetical protein
VLLDHSAPRVAERRSDRSTAIRRRDLSRISAHREATDDNRTAIGKRATAISMTFWDDKTDV